VVRASSPCDANALNKHLIDVKASEFFKVKTGIFSEAMILSASAIRGAEESFGHPDVTIGFSPKIKAGFT
jgi:hypothetical protein